MKHQVRYLFVAGLAAATVFSVAPAAHATSLSTLQSTVHDISSDMDDASAAADATDSAALADACSALYDDVTLALSYSRPKPMPRSAWRYSRSAWRLFQRASTLCEDGANEYDSDKIDEAAGLFTEAGQMISLAADEMP